jgi:hypothetical protein
VNTSFIWNFEKLEVKIYAGAALLLINQLANNLEVQDREMFGITFSTKRSEIRAITELINRYRKNLFWTRKQSGNSPLGHCKST